MLKHYLNNTLSPLTLCLSLSSHYHYGCNLFTFSHSPLAVLSNINLSWSLLALPFQNSTRDGTRRNPPQCGGRGMSSPSPKLAMMSFSCCSSSSLEPMVLLWLLLHAPILLPRGRELKYSSDSCSDTFSTVPSIRTERSRSPHQKVMAAWGFTIKSWLFLDV